jgi:hypothetical protein
MGTLQLTDAILWHVAALNTSGMSLTVPGTVVATV